MLGAGGRLLRGGGSPQLRGLSACRGLGAEAGRSTTVTRKTLRQWDPVPGQVLLSQGEVAVFGWRLAVLAFWVKQRELSKIAKFWQWLDT